MKILLQEQSNTSVTRLELGVGEDRGGQNIRITLRLVENLLASVLENELHLLTLCFTLCVSLSQELCHNKAVNYSQSQARSPTLSLIFRDSMELILGLVAIETGPWASNFGHDGLITTSGLKSKFFGFSDFSGSIVRATLTLTLAALFLCSPHFRKTCPSWGPDDVLVAHGAFETSSKMSPKLNAV
eukprot:g73787.t1